MPLFTALVTHNGSLSAFSRVVLPTFSACEVGSVVTFGLFWLVFLVTCLFPFSFVTIYVLALQLATLLTFVSVVVVPVSTLFTLLPSILIHILPRLYCADLGCVQL